MSVFKEKYANIYDITYQRKDYKAEVDFLDTIFKEHNIKKVLDIGCGTGRHSSILAQQGYTVFGIDKSPDMIKIAQKKIKNSNLKFKCDDILNFKSSQKFDACVCLFDVLGYLKKRDIPQFFKIVSRHLRKDGLFIVDYWDTDDVILHGLTKVIIKSFKAQEKIIIRLTTSSFKRSQAVIKWRFLVLPNFEIFQETHQKETFYLAFLHLHARLAKLKLLKMIRLSDINPLLVFQKQ